MSKKVDPKALGRVACHRLGALRFVANPADRRGFGAFRVPLSVSAASSV